LIKIPEKFIFIIFKIFQEFFIVACKTSKTPRPKGRGNIIMLFCELCRLENVIFFLTEVESEVT
jgi:hypothetical protein